MEDDVREKPMKWVTPYEGFSFLSGHDRTSSHNHPTMYGYGLDTLVVVAEGIREEFHLREVDKAFECYRKALVACGYYE